MRRTRTATEVLYKGSFVSLHRDSVQRPGAFRGTYDYVEAEDAVRVAAVDDEGYVTLVEDDFYLQKERVLHLPGGGIGGQDPREAALRELREETGLHTAAAEPLGAIAPLPGITPVRMHLYLATGLRQGPAEREPTESGMSMHRMSLSTAVEAVRDGRIYEAGSATALLLEQLTLG